ncbi:MAG: hypothetical protein JWM05_3062, partial [Acidimicrobiales bacterium]|nr:hypothetical protein [Acidimicrobiales bacterium]
RLPLPVAGPAWLVARVAAELLGAPLPPHVRELMVRGRCADGAAAVSMLGVSPRPTPDVVRQLYDWETVASVAVPQRGTP